jgi:5-(hydroxymethyl)furfural/furfural oxidase
VITLWVNKTFSELGQVRLASPDWREEPRGDFNLLADQRDLTRLMDGFMRIASLHELQPMKAVTSDAFPASFTDRIRKVGDVNLQNKLLALKNKLLTAVGAWLLNGPSSLRRFMIRNFTLESA